jgi:2-C-methyl-D-erythritol 2,4-cyclodiphosphate synthase
VREQERIEKSLMDVPPKQPRRVHVQGLAPARKPASGDTLAPGVSPFRIGHGYDIHKLQPGGKLMLGGVEVSNQISPIAHSDGDVVIHALVDALLGAMGWGDIGEHFPPEDEQWRGAASSIFLRTTMDRVRAAGFAVVNADITILAERPKILSFKAQMSQSLREMLGTSSFVNIKAGTNEGCDAVGAGQAIAAHAVVLLAAES